MLDFLLNNDPLLAVIAFFIVLIPLILIHELGHFLAAKSAGITILEFGIGFPPRMRKLFTWRGTEFTLNWLPLGGFVRPFGEDMIRPLDEETLAQEREEYKSQQSDNPQAITELKSVNDSRPLGRIWFMAAGALANFILALILFAIVALLGTQEFAGSTINTIRVKPGSVLAQAGLRDGDIITDVDGQKFVNPQEIIDRYYQSEKPVTLTVQRGEKNVEIVVPAWDNKQESSLENYVQVLLVVTDAPAGKAGLQPGDIIIGFNGDKIINSDNFRDLTRSNAGKEVTLKLQRGDKTLEVTLTPRVNPPEGQGAMGIVIAPILDDTTIGLTYGQGPDQEKIIPKGLSEAIPYSINQVTNIINMTVSIPAQVLNGTRKPQDARPVSVVGMSQIGARILQDSVEQKRITPILEFIASISVALGFFNLLPIPALDGGRILFVLIEVIRGRPIAPEREGLVHLIGLALLLSLSVIIILNDIKDPILNSIP